MKLFSDGFKDQSYGSQYTFIWFYAGINYPCIFFVIKDQSDFAHTTHKTFIMGTEVKNKKVKRKNFGFIAVDLHPTTGEFSPTMEFAVYDLYAQAHGVATQTSRKNKSFSHCLQFLRRRERAMAGMKEAASKH